MSGSENRKRQHRLTVRLTEEEYFQIKEDANRAGISVASYLRSLALNTPPPRQAKRPPVEVGELRKLLGQIGKIGSNINQIAKSYNTGFFPSKEETTLALAALIDMKNATLEVLGKRKAHDT